MQSPRKKQEEGAALSHLGICHTMVLLCPHAVFLSVSEREHATWDTRLGKRRARGWVDVSRHIAWISSHWGGVE